MNAQTDGSYYRKELYIPAPGVIELRSADCPDLASADTLIQNHCSIISPGTERAVLAGLESWARLPFVPGYGSVGTVVRGGAAWQVQAGDRVLTYGQHASLIAGHALVAKVPDGVSDVEAVMARMAMVAITALRVAHIELGDPVVIQGAGLVGQLAAQLVRLQGGLAIVVDVDDHRLQLAKQCGASAVVNARRDDCCAAIKAEAQGLGVHTVIEASGLPDLVLRAIDYCDAGGEVILLGSPRGPFTGDATELLKHVHMGKHVSLKGAIEWRYLHQSVAEDPGLNVKHTLQRNLQIVLHCIASGQLQVQALVSRVVSPNQAPQVYRALAQGSSELGVIFDWASEA